MSRRYVVAWPTYPVPSPLRNDEGEVLTFPTRREAVRYGKAQGVPFPHDNVAVFRGQDPGQKK